MKCDCKFCKTYDKYRWATIMECPCNCHEESDIVGHDGLCCPFPNGKKKDNPYEDLMPASYYKEILDKMYEEV